MRWAVSYSIDRQQMLDVGAAGLRYPHRTALPAVRTHGEVLRGRKPLLEKYPTNEYNPEKAAALMTEHGL